jgi:UDP-N-acetylglucosamine 2-epimerase
MKIVFIVGARPQFIKLAPLCNLLKNESEVLIIHTGQHFDNEMSAKFFSDLNIQRPKYNLEVNNGLHGEQTGRMLISLEKVLLEERPNLVVVFGDTNSTLAGSLVASKLQFTTIHIEAGLRSLNKTMPEEINRIVSDHTSDFLFAPTTTAINNLILENLIDKSFLTGDVMVDSLKFATKNSTNSNILDTYSLNSNRYYLLTLHRPYNVDDPKQLSKILKEIAKLSQLIVFPIHPRTKKVLEENNINTSSNIMLIPPIGYIDFVKLQTNSLKIITDSGGIQKEAYILKKPCITLRSETEWIETVELGWNKLINPNTITEYSKIIESFEPNCSHPLIFGDNVAQKMNDIIHSIMESK